MYSINCSKVLPSAAGCHKLPRTSWRLMGKLSAPAPPALGATANAFARTRLPTNVQKSTAGWEEQPEERDDDCEKLQLSGVGDEGDRWGRMRLMERRRMWEDEPEECALVMMVPLWSGSPQHRGERETLTRPHPVWARLSGPEGAPSRPSTDDMKTEADSNSG